MSYILDALRKSDQLRQRGATPKLLALPAAITEPRRSSATVYGAIAIVLLGAGVVIGSLRPWHIEPPVPAEEAIAIPRPVNSDPRPVEPPPVKQELLAKVMQEPPPQMPIAKAPSKALSIPAPGIPLSAALGDPAAENEAIAMDELPLSVQQDLPKMAISLHAYSRRPEDRLVSINNRLLREGGNPAPGVRLEQITPDGMILSYKGYRFRRGVQ
ncbi:MAG: general secretion pathway protein GspB [Rhizobium sp.]